VATLCNDARDTKDGAAGDPTDRALLRWVEHERLDAAALRERHARIADVPFDPDRRYMRVDCAFRDGPRQLVKGAPEAVTALVQVPLPSELAAAIRDAAERGERVLLLAEGVASGSPSYVGLLRLHDPPRPEVPAAVAACRRAGIRVLMLTGDHPATARAIAIRIGLCDEHSELLEGGALDALDDPALIARLRSDVILARITPEQKLRVVRTLQAAGEVVTVTGDGVNDAPALRVADVGIAMGRRGTEVAKQASDIVLLDDNFATIVAAIEEGRAIKHNIRRFASYVFTSNVAELVPLPPEPPRPPLLTRVLAVRTFLFYGLVESTLGMIAFFAVFWTDGWRPFDSLTSHESAAVAGATLTFLGIVGGQIGCLFAQRAGSLRARLSLRRNPWIAFGIAVELVIALALVYTPGVDTVFSMVAVSPACLPRCRSARRS
jgi:magnesium-transporting ATPase (P-type)